MTYRFQPQPPPELPVRPSVHQRLLDQHQRAGGEVARRDVPPPPPGLAPEGLGQDRGAEVQGGTGRPREAGGSLGLVLGGRSARGRGGVGAGRGGQGTTIVGAAGGDVVVVALHEETGAVSGVIVIVVAVVIGGGGGGGVAEAGEQILGRRHYFIWVGRGGAGWMELP